MPLIGVMTARVPNRGMPRQSISKTWDIFANYALTEHMKTLVFDPVGIHGNSETVSGWEYQQVDEHRPIWSWVTRRIPSVIYDGAFLKDLRNNPQYRSIRRKLRQKQYRVFNPPFPNKFVIHKYLSTTHANNYLPNTERIFTSDQAVSFLQQQQWMFLKPIRGTGGKGIVEIKVSTHADSYTVSYDPSNTKRLTQTMSKKELRLFIRGLLRTQRFIAQKAVSLIGTNKQKIDFRVALYRDRLGKWQCVDVICKLGDVGSPVTNFHSGGIIIPYSRVEEYQKEFQFPLPAKDRLIEAAIIGADALRKRYPDLGTLGIDIGVDDEGNIWALDFNPRQGRDIMNKAQIQLAMKYTAEFAKFLFTSKGGRV